MATDVPTKKCIDSVLIFDNGLTTNTASLYSSMIKRYHKIYIKTSSISEMKNAIPLFTKL